MNILLTGASGFVGNTLTRALLAAGQAVKPASRREGLDFARMLSPAQWRPYLEGIDAVINCVGIIGENGRQRFDHLHHLAPKALFQACEDAGVRRVVQISALGADARARSKYHRSKRAADEALMQLDLDWFVLRPSLIYGPGGASTRFFMKLAALPWLPVMNEGRQVLQPVHISDVVAAALLCLRHPKPRRVIEVVGAEPIEYVDWLRCLRRAQGLPNAPVIKIPGSLCIGLARLGHTLSPLCRPDNLRMLAAGNQGSVEPLAEFLGRMPRRLAPRLLFTDGLFEGLRS